MTVFWEGSRLYRLAKCGQLTLAKCGIGQTRFGQMRPNKDGQIRFAKFGRDLASLVSALKVIRSTVKIRGLIVVPVFRHQKWYGTWKVANFVGHMSQRVFLMVALSVSWGDLRQRADSAGGSWRESWVFVFGALYTGTGRPQGHGLP